ncbi:hypothetical protein B0H34DRAFT_703906 [Crassisporium funariophilum]|nr:hypothetical protein B0H34DRAFT_703906 [Crassisporium funariophilum]
MKLHAIVALSALQLAVASADKLNPRHAKRQPPATTTPPPLDTSTTIPPLAHITYGMPTKVAPVFQATHTPGAKPPLAGAPNIPGALVLGSWPIQDKTPPTDSPEVQKWMKELEGFHIPDLAPTKGSTCDADPAAAANSAARGWWTCGGHIRSTDIVACPDKLNWGVSFDDGPSPYSTNLLKKLDEKDVKVTFFVVGSRVIERPNILIEEYMSGHEISVHTWSHSALTTLTTEQIVAELGWTRKAIRTVLGVTPTTMRPPKGDIDDRVRAISLAMGMIPILWTSTPDGGKFDSNDWRVAGGIATGPESYQSFEGLMNNGSNFPTGFITLQHDLFEITVDLAIGYTLDAAIAHQPKFELKPIGECMNLPAGNLYRETNQNATFPYTNTSGGVDIDGDGSVDFGTGAGAGFTNTIPFWSSISLVGLAIFGALL